MQLTLYSRDSPNTSRRFALVSSNAWSMKTRRAPSRRCRDARVYGHTTTAMHDMSTAPTLPPSSMVYEVCCSPFSAILSLKLWETRPMPQSPDRYTQSLTLADANYLRY